jgi:hypothetical protein
MQAKLTIEEKIMLENIEDSMNAMTDMDMGWWPVLFLRPEKDKDIDNLVLFKLSLVFGSALGVFFSLGYLLFAKPINWGLAVILFLAGWVVFFFGYKFTYAYFWNRRAKRLRAAKSIR